MASRRRFAKANRFLRRRRRPTSFDGDFGLDDLFEEHAESKEEKQHANHKIGSTMCRYEPLFSDEEVAEAEAAARLKRVAEKKAREAERLSGWRRRRHGRRSGSNAPVPPLQHTNETYQTECRMHFSANILSVKVVSSDIGFPIHVYGTVIARDSVDKKCVYLFRCHRRDSQLIKSEDESLILTGPARGLLLIDFIWLETDLKIKGERGQDKILSKGLPEIDGRLSSILENIKVRDITCDSRLSTVEVKYAVVKTHTTSILHRIVLYDSKAGGVATSDGSGAIQLWRRVIAVCLNEKLMLTVDSQASNDIQIIQFGPSLNGASQHVIYCGAIKLCLKVTWSVITE
ncbi:hypothetical protein SETIT_7G257700v2 [Setaria italica]|uniref:DUF6598 domain-containing protein n=1 Tax=Setaria italica TaxID=4555 RepID=A0A368S006_SETIT|nr:hypothetical protein SETIT_7G257700v2 [Setaria italica]